MKQTMKKTIGGTIKRLMAVSLALIAIMSSSVDPVNGRRFAEDDVVQMAAVQNTRHLNQIFGSSKQIYLEFGKYFWRLDMIPPALKIGWDFVQSQLTLSTQLATTTLRAYRMRLKTYGTANIDIKSTLNIDRFFYNELNAKMPEFSSYIFNDVYIIYGTKTFQQTFGGSPKTYTDLYYNRIGLCFSSGYAYEDIQILLTARLKFQNCYKMIIQSFCDWSQWYNLFDPKKEFLFGLLDSCTASEDDKVTIYNYVIFGEDSGDKPWVDDMDFFKTYSTLNTADTGYCVIGTIFDPWW